MEATTFEICCGSAGLSDALRCLGFQVYPTDHAAIRQGQSFHPRCFEFRSGAALGTNVAPLQTVSHSHGLTVWKMLKSKREPTLAKFGGRMDPPQLRDANHLMGLPNLRAADQAKVDPANQLYRCAIHLLWVCMTIGCLLSIENPARSWLWALLAMLVKETQDSCLISWFANLESVYFDACAHGSTRDKRTKLLSTPGLFTSLEASCTKITCILRGNLFELNMA